MTCVQRGTKFNNGISFLNAFSQKEDTQKDVKNALAVSLDQKWQIWYWRQSGRINGTTDKLIDNWTNFFEMKSSFTSRDEFWRSYNDINGYEFGLLSSFCDYCVFKEGIKPMWEHKANRNGGRWLMKFPRDQEWANMSYLDEIWLKVLLALTGHNFDDCMDEICGIVLMIRPNINKIAVWTSRATNVLANLKIGEILKSCTGYKGEMEYLAHSSTVNILMAKEAKEEKKRIERCQREKTTKKSKGSRNCSRN